MNRKARTGEVSMGHQLLQCKPGWTVTFKTPSLKYVLAEWYFNMT